jgi:chromosome segregation protein
MEACQARRNLLEDMMTHYEGYESGVVEAMEAKDRWSHLAGTVADIFVPVAGMEGVLQAALGEMSKFLVCHDRHEAEKIIDYLKTEGKGRVGILVPRMGSIAPAMKRPELDIPGVVGWLDNYVSTDETLKPLKEAILSRTVVFEPDADVDAILERLPFGFGAVSTTGVLYSKNLISGGSDDDFPLFRRQELVDEQARLIEDFGRQTTSLQEKRNQNTATLGGLRAESDQVANQLEEILETIETQQRELAETEFDSRSLSTEFDRLTSEKRNLAGRLESVRNRQYSLGLDSSELATQKESLVNEIQQAANHLGQLEENASKAAAEVSRLQVAAIEARSRVDHTQHQIRHLNELLGGIGQSRVSKTSEMDQAHQDIKQAETRLQTLQSDLKVAFERREQQTERQDGMRAQQAELMTQTSEKETKVKALRHEKDSTSEKLHQTDIRLTAIGSEISSLGERFLAEYEVDIAELTVTRPEEEITDEAALELVAGLKDKLRTFGAVNLLALEEYDVANEREKFLNAQLADLTTAKADLKSTIHKINKTARQLFNDTFEKVQGHFSALFVDLFAGGEARISLVDPDDPLESDIEIIARPGGKKLLGITMLSGGERALTAISLLFSLYLVKPSPFCILDEIDAPLDDANCQRFLKIIKTFSNQTQFICITHNKITMEASNNLYGITMERPGVSKLVAVKFTAGKDGGEEELVEVAPEEGEEVAVDETAGLEPVTVEPDELAQPVVVAETDDAELPESIQDRLTPPVPTNPDSDA